jgi:rhodanese-related sulfurtransferase
MGIKTINAETLKDWLERREAVLVDVREPAEHAAESIPGAISLPLSTVTKKALPDAGNKKIVLHCKAGKRSLNACENLIAEEPSLELFNLEGGIGAWEKAGYFTKKG